MACTLYLIRLRTIYGSYAFFQFRLVDHTLKVTLILDRIRTDRIANWMDGKSEGPHCWSPLG